MRYMPKILHKSSNIICRKPMISAAANIKSVTEELKKMPIRHLYDATRNPRDSTKALLRQLRIVRQLNPNQYSALKQQLPYFVCAMFNPPYRRTENFAYTEYFIVDIDHISEKGLLIEDLFQKITKDNRTMLCFKSPGGDGLKVIMKLSERCYDAGLYKTFYKVFLMKYSKQFGIEQVVDYKTCDVTRACFLSADENAYFNSKPECVVIAEYLNPDEDASLAFDIKRETEKALRENEKNKDSVKEAEPSKDVITQIRETLHLQTRQTRKKREAFVPHELDEIMEELKKYVEEKGIILSGVTNIQYGKKLAFKVAMRKAEINLFYGNKRGFTAVQSPKTGTDKEANELMADVINSFLMEKL